MGDDGGQEAKDGDHDGKGDKHDYQFGGGAGGEVGDVDPQVVGTTGGDRDEGDGQKEVVGGNPVGGGGHAFLVGQ